MNLHFAVGDGRILIWHQFSSIEIREIYFPGPSSSEAQKDSLHTDVNFKVIQIISVVSLIFKTLLRQSRPSDFLKLRHRGIIRTKYKIIRILVIAG